MSQLLQDAKDATYTSFAESNAPSQPTGEVQTVKTARFVENNNGPSQPKPKGDNEALTPGIDTPNSAPKKRNPRFAKGTPHPNKGQLNKDRVKNVLAQGESVLNQLTHKNTEESELPKEARVMKTPHPNKGVLNRAKKAGASVLDQFTHKANDDDDFESQSPKKSPKKRSAKFAKGTPHPNKAVLDRGKLAGSSVLDQLTHKATDDEVPVESRAMKTPHPNKGVLQRGGNDVLNQLAGKVSNAGENVSEMAESKPKKNYGKGTPHPSKRNLGSGARGYMIQYVPKQTSENASPISVADKKQNEGTEKQTDGNGKTVRFTKSSRHIKFEPTETIHKFHAEDPVSFNESTNPSVAQESESISIN